MPDSGLRRHTCMDAFRCFARRLPSGRGVPISRALQLTSKSLRPSRLIQVAASVGFPTVVSATSLRKVCGSTALWTR
ncbi:hypothetical protein AMK29_23950 [Streptomyces sp. CB02261]|nr:hypothetical protein AMK29_23950 [Streptomyces sp. CB02261]